MLAQRTPVALVALSLLMGCAVGPDYVRPDVMPPSASAGALHDGLSSGLTEADLAAWWTTFGDPGLGRVVARALAENLDLAQAQARVAQARAGLGAARAALRPAGTLEGQASRAYQSVETPLGQVLNASPGFDRYGSSYEVQLGASWELDLFGGLRREREAALADYQATTAGATATRLAVAAQTADLYISIRGLQTRLDVARRQVQTQQELRAMVDRLHGKGLAPERQLRQAEGALAQVQASVPVLEQGLSTAMNALDVMLGQAPGTSRGELADRHAIPTGPRITAAGSPGDLLRRRPDLMVAERRLAAANARIGVAVAEYYPKLSLSGLVGSATAVSGGNLFSGGAQQAAGVLGLRWRLFDFGRIDAQIEAARGREAELLAAYRLAALRATEDVENAFAAVLRSDEQAQRLAEAVEAFGRARETSSLAFEKGAVSLIEVLQADESLLRAADAEAQARTASARATVAAFTALGGGWEPEGSVAIALR